MAGSDTCVAAAIPLALCGPSWAADSYALGEQVR